MTHATDRSGPPRPQIRRISQTEAPILARFLQDLSEGSTRLFRPLGRDPEIEKFEAVVRGNAPEVDDRLDLVAVEPDGRIVGWCFVCRLREERPGFGLGVADHRQGQGLGRALMTRLFDGLQPYRLSQVHLTVVKNNAAAGHLYRSFGFRIDDEMVGRDDGLTYLCMVKDL
jgi:ribosomal protein S18 acetylase RimI-like enzyme